MSSKYIVNSAKSFADACAAMELRVPANKFGILHIHDLKETMKKKGVEFDRNVKVFEVCNPHKAKAVLDTDLSFNMALPCRVSVWEEESGCKIGMIRPKAILGLMAEGASFGPAMDAVADEVETIMKTIIDETAAM